jgi:glucose-6-phosphate dehydrogenase assembly protein OpcA
MSAGVQPEELLKKLRESRSPPQTGDRKDKAALRACSMTLIIADGEAGDVRNLLEGLAREYPSRAIAVHAGAASGHVQADVTSMCWSLPGHEQHVCCETVAITVDPDQLDQAASIARALIVPDLPVVFYCRSPRLLSRPGVEELSDLAGRIIADSISVADFAPVLAKLAAYDAAGLSPSDFAWTRLTRWREMISQIFDDAGCADIAPSIAGATIEWEGEHQPSSAYYMAAWLEQSLSRRLDFRLVRAGECDHARIKSVHLRGPGVDLSVSVDQTQAAEVVALARSRHTVLPRPSELELLREELSIFSHDPVYDGVLRRMPELLLR